MLVPAPPDPFHAFEPLTREDAPELRPFFAACRDYVRLAEGREPSEAQLDDLFGELPPGKDLSDKLVLGLRRRDGALTGVLEVVRGFPGPAEWFMGLFLLLPEARGRGLGARAYAAAEAWMAAEGASSIYLAVVAQNPRARAFWEQQGYGEVYRKVCRVGACDCEVARLVKRVG